MRRRPRCSRRAGGGGALRRGGRGGTGAAMPPPFFSAVSATTAPATPGMALTTRSAAARSGSSSLARAAGTVIEKKTLPSAMKMSETMPRLTMSPSKSGPLHGPQAFEDGFLGDGHGGDSSVRLLRST